MQGKKWIVMIIVVLISLSTAAAVYASAAATIERSVMANGGGSYSGGIMLLAGTLGQPVVGSGGTPSMLLSSGFWVGGEASSALRIYLPLITFEEQK